MLLADNEKLTAPPVVVVNAGPGRRCENRRFEWWMTFSVAGVALVLMVSPRAIEQSRFFMMTEFGLTQPFLLLYAAVVGCVGACALFFNGKLPSGYLIRTLCAGARSVLWGNMALALAANGSIEAFSITVPVLVGLFLGELDAGYRSLVDRGNAHRAATGPN